MSSDWTKKRTEGSKQGDEGGRLYELWRVL